ncbi:ADP-ribose pyrophosphatase [Paenibacillus darwinianus]|uniref:ADP-ribose pyrophosphatase n=1 Tax=Paenibacillus darwinianus TaxID=1380763 RepID=A0A9W5S242_9BACL|nr:NUDIX hydrolase [Paenibacillus darwinianus]EXX88273.1 ADP-ribose pyrophosphatase [Paenibacillus darwinianus]EXX88610.1 ADP-ribose pyrophosphatase [Paenibacillus darwinianus]EXX91745.1 ADP-ribose pyrophosphatase [Paenibacillus darwinianus]
MENDARTEQWTEKTLNTEPIFSGRMISLQVDTVELPGGGSSTREIVRHPGASAVIALVDGKLLVVEQYRKPLEKFQVEIPAGKLDPGEDPVESAYRELEEETGYKAGSMKLLHAFYTSPGFADEKLFVYLAEDLTPGEMALDSDEFLTVEALTFEEAQRYIKEERISDAKTILAVQAWQLYRLTGQWQA